jgi:hypothetical protein
MRVAGAQWWAFEQGGLSMSVFVCNPEHIGLIAAYIVKQVSAGSASSSLVEPLLKEGTTAKNWAISIAKAMAQMNINSAKEFYPEDADGHRPGPALKDDQIVLEAAAWAVQYVGRPMDWWMDEPTNPGHMLKYVECYIYQSNQAKNWHSPVGWQMARLIDWMNTKYKRPRVNPEPGPHPWEWSE